MLQLKSLYGRRHNKANKPTQIDAPVMNGHPFTADKLCHE